MFAISHFTGPVQGLVLEVAQPWDGCWLGVCLRPDSAICPFAPPCSHCLILLRDRQRGGAASEIIWHHVLEWLQILCFGGSC
jgi:hypothetical protein